MNRIDAAFNKIKNENKKALIGYMTAGYPNLDTSISIIKEMCRSGVDVIELGIPFSDPISDGPIIQEASQLSLANGIDMKKVFEIIKAVRVEYQTPIIIFSYFNPIYVYGLDSFCEHAKEAGADGALIVDLSFEESAEVAQAFGYDFPLIRLIAPTTDFERVKEISSDANGFLYLISRTGVTGSGEMDYENLFSAIRQFRSITSLPLCVGFGISTQDHARNLCKEADGIIIGSEFLKSFAPNMPKGDTVNNVAQKIVYFRQALDNQLNIR